MHRRSARASRGSIASFGVESGGPGGKIAGGYAVLGARPVHGCAAAQSIQLVPVFSSEGEIMRMRTSAAALAAGFAAASMLSVQSFAAVLPIPYTVQLQ